MKRWLGMALLLILSGCGGAISLVSTEKAVEPPAPVPPPAARSNELFVHGRSSGSLMVPISLYSSKTMEDAAESMLQRSDVLARELCRSDRGFESIEVVVTLDAASATRSRLQLTQTGAICRTSLGNFLGRAFQLAKQEMRNDWEGSLFPLEAMATLVESVLLQPSSAQLPGWVHALYLRDEDLFIAKGYETIGVGAWEKTLTCLPLSSFRSTLSSVSYVDSNSRCRPPVNRQGPGLRKYMGQVPGIAFELCDLSPKSLEKFTDQIYSVSSRVILAVPAKPDSIVVHLAGAPLRHEHFQFISASNEIILRALAGAKVDDSVEVDYEPK
jgi:hypothetical protein